MITDYKLSRATLDGLVGANVLHLLDDDGWLQWVDAIDFDCLCAEYNDDGEIEAIERNLNHVCFIFIENKGWSFAVDVPMIVDFQKVQEKNVPFAIWDDPEDNPIGMGDNPAEALLNAINYLKDV